MPQFIAAPTIVEAAGNKLKWIEEYAGRVSSKHAEVSVVRMVSPEGWVEPGQTPEFMEIIVVLSGLVLAEYEGGEQRVASGQAIIVDPGEWIRFSTPEAEGAEYMAICLPAFSTDIAHRDEGR